MWKLLSGWKRCDAEDRDAEVFSTGREKTISGESENVIMSFKLNVRFGIL